MPLKRLELCNFKSYRGQQEIDFGLSSFTCVIGPNGSGKSNLMDAISFVLGVKSSQLRSTQLKELIYRGRKAAEPIDDDENGSAAPGTNGTAKIKIKSKGKGKAGKSTLGKRKQREDDSDISDDEEQEEDDENEEEEEGNETDAKSAWVMAVYEDQEEKEWKFKRSINRAGMSTYNLNGAGVSYAIYDQALQKHNILVKAKNFLVFQGDVEAVASQSPKDLARLIDQISGSLDLASDYLTAKARADKSTDLTSQNYSKKRGIASEYKQFKEQKAEVDRWESMQEERSETVVQYLLWKLFHIESAIESAQEKIEERMNSLEDFGTHQTEEEKRLSSFKKKQAKANLDVKKQESVVKNAESALDEKRPDLVKLQTQIQHAQKKIGSSSIISKELEKDVERQKTTVKSLKKDLVDAEEAEEQAAEAQREASQKQGVTLNAADLEEYRMLKATANADVIDERQRLEVLRREERTLRDKLNTAQDKISKAETRREELKQELASVEAKEDAHREDVNETDRERKAVQKEMETLQAERSRYNQLETEYNEKLQDAYNKLLQAKHDRRESEREIKLKEALSNLKKVFPGVHGRVIDLCKPTQQKYNVAIQTVLGRNIDSVVVDHQKTAIECIEYMRNQRAGQATFIPLDTIQHKNDAVDKFRSVHKGARLAIDIIQYEPTVERAMQYACGTALVCDTEEIAKHIRYARNLAVKTVTLEGTVIHKSGLITGGQGSGGGRKFDDVEVAGIEKTRDGLMTKLRDLQSSKPRSEADNQLTTTITRLNAKLAIGKDNLATTSRTAEGLRKEIKSLDTSITKLKSDLKAISIKHEAQVTKVEEVVEIVDAADDAVFEGFCHRIGVESIREYENVQLRAAEQENAALLKYRSQIARLNLQLKFEEKQLAATEARLQTLRTSIEKETRNIENILQVKKSNLEDDIKQAESDLEKEQQVLSVLKEVFVELTKQVEDCRKAYINAVKTLDQAKKEIATFYDEIEAHAAERFAIYKRCKLEEIDLPLDAGSLAKVPIEESKGLQSTVDEGEDGSHRSLPTDFGVSVNFDGLDEDEREDASEEVAKNFENRIATLTLDIEKVAPNLKAVEKLSDVENKMRVSEKEAEEAKKENREAKEAFNKVKKKRCDLFNKAFDHISREIDNVYKALTKGKAAPQGGVAYLSLEDSDEPYLSGIKYHAMPPMKRFRDMEQLSGGEKTMAALALLFAIHSYQPSPFFVLDEVDAALDNTNVARIANYIRKHSSPSFQFIVISLKGSLYERSNNLVGIYRDQDVNSSKSLTLNLQKYDE